MARNHIFKTVSNIEVALDAIVKGFFVQSVETRDNITVIYTQNHVITLREATQ